MTNLPELDPQGYLLNRNDWTPEIARRLAIEDGIQLTDPHWTVINFLRDFYDDFQTAPPVRAMVKTLRETHGSDIGNSAHLQQLFPEGPLRQASKLAGLPKPARCL